MLVQRLFQFLYIAWIVTEILVLVVTRTRGGGKEVQDRGSLRVLWLTILISLTLGMWAGATLHFGRMRGLSLSWFIVGLMALGLVIRWSAIYTLGKSFSANVAIHATQRLNRSGLFQIVRHPSYTGLMLVILSMGLVTGNWLALAVTVLPPVAALLYRIRVEETALTGAFGQEYVDYSRTTPRLFPGIY